jgi:caa(3)-type oxidase subunit IV
MGAHGIDHYWKIYLWLCGLFAISFAGPYIGDSGLFDHDGWYRFVFVMTTAFAVAFVKAYLVIKHFMHVMDEKRFMHYALITALVFMALFVAAIAPDVRNHEGRNWVNKAAQDWSAEQMALGPAGAEHGHHGEGHGDEHAADGEHAAEGDHGEGDHAEAHEEEAAEGGH